MCERLWKVKFHIDSDFLGISLSSLMTKHRFLAKAANIGFQDFLNYTVRELNDIVDEEIQVKRKAKNR